MKTIRYGSVFTGVGGLDEGIAAAFEGRLEQAWHVESDAYCRAVLRKLYSLTEQYDDVCRVGGPGNGRKHILEPVNIIVGGSPCFAAGTLIETPDGSRPIETIREGDLVLTHKRRFRPVVRTMVSANAPLIEVLAFGAPPIRTTAEHPFYARRRYRSWNNLTRRYDRMFGPPRWVPASQLTRNHFVAQPISDEPIQRRWESVSFWYLVGRWLGDGWIREGRRKQNLTGKRGSRVNGLRSCGVIICCAPHEATELATYIRNAGFHATRSDDRTAVKFRISSTAFVDFLKPFGRGAGAKRVPGLLFGAPREVLAALWAGWEDSDGWIRSDGTISVDTISRPLAVGMARVARILFDSPVRLYQNKKAPLCVIEGRTVRQRTSFTVRVRPTKNRGERGAEGFNENGFSWVPVRSVKETDERAEVFNLEVSRDNSYVADSIVVHNCTDLSNAGKRAGLAGKESALWFEYLRIIRELRPRLLVFENVAAAISPIHVRNGSARSLAEQAALGRILGDLAECGYDAWWYCIRVGRPRHRQPAAHVNGPHGRNRLFIVAWSVADADRKRSERAGDKRDATGRTESADGGEGELADADGSGLGTRVGNVREGESDTGGRGEVGLAHTESEREREPTTETNAIAEGRDARPVARSRGERMVDANGARYGSTERAVRTTAVGAGAGEGLADSHRSGLESREGIRPREAESDDGGEGSADLANADRRRQQGERISKHGSKQGAPGDIADRRSAGRRRRGPKLANTDRAGLEVSVESEEGNERTAAERDDSGTRTAESGLGRGAARSPARVDGIAGSNARRGKDAFEGDAAGPKEEAPAHVWGERWPARPGEQQYDWEPPRTARNVAFRAQRLKALGNLANPAQVIPVGMVARMIYEELFDRDE